MALYVELDKWHPPEISESAWKNLLKDKTMEEACTWVKERGKINVDVDNDN